MKNVGLVAFVVAIGVLTGRCPAWETREGFVRFDFETGDLQGWEVVEGAFDYFVSDRPEFHNRYPGVSRKGGFNSQA